MTVLRRRFRDRRDAGVAVAGLLGDFSGQPAVIVLGLPRGGVPVAFEVARALAAPLDVFVVRKLGVPGQEELAMGAIASGGMSVVNDDVIRLLGIPDSVFLAAAEREQLEVDRREHLYRGDRAPLDLAGRTAILVDDGIATGSTMTVAVAAVRKLAARIIVAVPVAAGAALDALQSRADGIVCVYNVADLEGVSLWYEDFRQTTDAEVRSCLAGARTV